MRTNMRTKEKNAFLSLVISKQYLKYVRVKKTDEAF